MVVDYEAAHPKEGRLSGKESWRGGVRKTAEEAGVFETASMRLRVTACGGMEVAYGWSLGNLPIGD